MVFILFVWGVMYGQGNEASNIISGKETGKNDEEMEFINEVEKSFFQNFSRIAQLNPYDTVSVLPQVGVPDNGAIQFGINDYVIEQRFAKLNKRRVIKLKYNRVVRDYLEFYIVKKKGFTEKLIALSRYFFPLIEEYLDRYDLPLELKYLVVIESAFNPFARSKAGAVGPWQFIYSTAKLYDLKVNSVIDERRDLRKSTEAACQYLKFLYETFGDWELAIAAYNCGPFNVIKAMKYAKSKDFWVIWNFLPSETRGYVPAFYAVSYIFNYYKEHGLQPPDIVHDDVFLTSTDTVMVRFPFRLSTMAYLLGIDTFYLNFLNAIYRVDFIDASEGTPAVLVLPVTHIGHWITNQDCIKEYFDSLANVTAVNNDHLFSARSAIKVIYHKVKRGESISRIARKYGCSVQDIMEWNNLSTRRIRPGQKIRIVVYQQLNSFSTDRLIVRDTLKDTSRYIMHVVRNGETLSSIVQLYGIKYEDIVNLNEFKDTTNLNAGARLIIRVPVSK